MAINDLRSEPFHTMVVLGESHVAGMCATQEPRRWVNIVADLITHFQGEPVVLHNKGIGANAISPRSPGYAASAKPSALERYHDDVIALKPDLFILAYGLNDMRAGMPPEDFRQDLARIITEVKEACAPVTVLTAVYHMSAYDWYPPYDVGSVAATEVFNLVIRQLAEQHGCILADIWAAEGQADWVVHPDTVHANDLGHLLIGHRVFEAIATHCSGVGARVTAELTQDRAETQPAPGCPAHDGPAPPLDSARDGPPALLGGPELVEGPPAAVAVTPTPAAVIPSRQARNLAPAVASSRAQGGLPAFGGGLARLRLRHSERDEESRHRQGRLLGFFARSECWGRPS